MKKFTAVGVYTSAGGFSRGMQDGGAKLIAHLHDGDFGYETLLANFPKVDTFAPYSEWPLDRLSVVEPDVMFCAPPCAPWSMGGGKGKKLDSDPRVEKFGHALQAGLTVKPRIWVMESVVNFSKSTELIKMLEETWTQRGYAITHFFSNYLLHGVPQNRNRYHFIASRVPLYRGIPREIDYDDRLPVAGDFLPSDAQEKWELITDNTYKKFDPIIRAHCPPGHRLRKVYRALAGLEDGEPGGPSFNYYRLRQDYPASTMLAKPRIIHPNGKRLINVREGMALAGYPPDFKLVGSTEEKKYNQLGKGVLPPMGWYLAQIFRVSLDTPKNFKIGDVPASEVIDWRDEAHQLLRQKPKPYPFPKEKFGSMRELRSWRRPENRDDDEDEE